MAKKKAPEPTIIRPDDIDPHHRWDRPLQAPGHTQVDFEERVNFRRLHDYRLARTRAALANSDLGALLCFDQHNIRYILSGNNFATEWLLPPAWYASKFDLVNLEAIHAKFGEVPLKHLPKLGVWQQLYYRRVKAIEDVKILDLVPYSKTQAKQFLIDELGWRDYGGKHYEQVFTRFYQGYILPLRYGIDKRKAHLSNLILNGEITREQALAELQQPTDDPERQQQDKHYVAKKLGWSDAEFDAILAQPPVPHAAFGTDATQRKLADLTIRVLQPFAKMGRRLMGIGK